jgi:branched-chain amino acid transport system ATP-binding protein
MLELNNIEAGYLGTTVLRDVSVRVLPATVVALLGPNGAGKTTLLRVASGALHPWRGSVLLDGKDLTAKQPFQLARAGICHVPEGRGIFPSLTVQENLRMHSSAPGKEVVEKAAAMFPVLGQRRTQKAGTLSGGEQQMLALCRAYLSNPRFVLLDEVSMGLAPLVVEEIFDFVKRIASEGTALLLVEQYVTKALAMADYVYMLNRGECVFSGSPDELDDDRIFAQYLGVS